MTIRNDPPAYSSAPRPNDRVDSEARDRARTATIVAVIAGIIALVALVIALVHSSKDFAPANCDPSTDYVCEPEIITETTTVDVPTTSLSPTEVPVPSISRSPVVTTTTVP